MKKLSIIIPVYNEESFIQELLNRVVQVELENVEKEIIVVNDGSTDASHEKIEDWMKEHPQYNIKLLRKENGGKGSAFRLGVANSTGDVVINQDADLEYDPNDYKQCIAPILSGEYKVVYGSRELGTRHNSPAFIYLMGGYFVSFCTDVLYFVFLTDEPTCYKTFDGELVRSLKIEGNRFDWEPELTAKCIRLGYIIKEVPINYHPRMTTEGKKIKWIDAVEAVWTLLIWRFKSKKKFYK